MRFTKRTKVSLGKGKLVLPSVGNVLSLKAGASPYVDANGVEGAPDEAYLVNTAFVPVIEKGLLGDYDKDHLPPAVHQFVLVIVQGSGEDSGGRTKAPDDAEVTIEVPYAAEPQAFTFGLSDFEKMEWDDRWVLRTLFVIGESDLVDETDFGPLHVFDVSDEDHPQGFVQTITVKATNLNRAGGKPFGEQQLILVETLPDLEVADAAEDGTVGPGQIFDADPATLITLPEEQVADIPPLRSVQILGGETYTDFQGEPDAFVARTTDFAPVLESFYVDRYVQAGTPPPNGSYTVLRVTSEDGALPDIDDLEVRLTIPLTGEDPLDIVVPAEEAVEAPGPSYEFRFLLVAGHDPNLADAEIPQDWNLILIDVTDEAAGGFAPTIDITVEALDLKRKLVAVEMLPDVALADEPATGEAGPGETYEAPAAVLVETAEPENA